MSRPPLGSAAQEAAALYTAVQEWVRARAGGLLADEHLATGSSECTSCPLCQGIGAVRHLHPEAVEHLRDAAVSVAAAVKAALAPPAPAGPAPAGPHPTPGGARPTPGGGHTPVQHITVQDDPGPA